MNPKFKIISIIVFILFAFSLVLPQVIEARSGCCSHHGGVCGCRCCDGTSLSAKCAPYYPSCSSPTTPKYNSPESYNPPKPGAESNTYTSPKSYTADASNTQLGKKSSNWIWWVIGLVIVGGVAYNYGKKRKER